MLNMRRLICKMKRNNAHQGLEKLFIYGAEVLFSLAAVVPESVYEKMNADSGYMMLGAGLSALVGIGLAMYNQEQTRRCPNYQI